MFEAERAKRQSSSSKKQSTRSQQFMEQVGWVCEELGRSDYVTREAFIDRFNTQKNEGNLRSHWSRAKNAVIAVKGSDGIVVKEHNNTLFLRTPSGLTQFATKQFQSDQDVEAKQYIGELVAIFLADEKLSGKMSCFFGSGSTVFHVGHQMCKHGPYDKLFATVNIPMAAQWCQVDHPPTEQVSIPEAVLETRRARLATIQKPSWSPAIAIVGADGFHYDPVKDEVSFYAMNESVALNTNLFVKSATDLVIVGLASRKMASGRNMGPLIDLPRGTEVRRALVTDKPPLKDIANAFRKARWTIITESGDWKWLPEPEPEQPSSPSTKNNVLPFS